MNLLIGASGFVGSNLLTQFDFQTLAGRGDLKDHQSTAYDYVYCAAPQAKKWLANKDPDFDMAQIIALVDDCKLLNCNKKFIHFSTIDVFDPPYSEGEELESKDSSLIHPYGSHRLLLERELAKIFHDKLLIVRLPALVGLGLKKNIIYDLQNNNQVDNINLNSSFQWFNLMFLRQYIESFIEMNLRIVNLVSEPISTRQIVKALFPDYLSQLHESSNSVHYNVKTSHAQSGYFLSADESLKHIRTYLDY